MAKRKWPIVVGVVGGIILLFVIVIIATLGIITAKGYGISTGRCLVADNGSYMLIRDNSPIVMSNQSGNTDLFKDLSTGDEILVLHSGIQESYPGQTGAYWCMMLEEGEIDDIPSIIIDELTELGWLNAQNDTDNLEWLNAESNHTKEGAVTDFGVQLFQGSLDAEKNTLISPISVLYALAMTANGAKGETLAEMETVFGMSISKLNEFLRAYASTLPEGEKYKLQLANGIWFKEDEKFTVNEEFLQTNADYYDVGIYKAPFNDDTLREINNWVSDKTEKRVQNIVDEIPEETVMYLVNALAFDAEWSKIYKDSQIQEGRFTKEDGTFQEADFMYSEEQEYLETNNATGFVKYYDDQKYAFVALLPKPGISIEDYVNTLDGEKLHQLLGNTVNVTVKTSLPRFESEYEIELSNVLQDMGMELAFDDKQADLSGIGSVPLDYNLVISRVLHKTYIAVGEKGTEAGAATSVEINAKSAAFVEEEPKVVYLNRPFVYIIIDCESKLPIFMGTTMSVAE